MATLAGREDNMGGGSRRTGDYLKLLALYVVLVLVVKVRILTVRRPGQPD